MNKLVNELAQKAEDYADDTDLPWLATYTEKFSDLLIEEVRARIVAMIARYDDRASFNVQQVEWLLHNELDELKK